MIYRFAIVTSKNVKGSYEIHNNGGRPFIVNVDCCGPKKIDVVDSRTGSIVLDLRSIQRAFVPKGAILNSRAHIPELDGNTILVHSKDSEYYWIGNRGIRKFNFPEPIVDFKSPIGNNDVPYPFAISERFCFLLLAQEVLYLHTIRNIENPYFEWYANRESFTSFTINMTIIVD